MTCVCLFIRSLIPESIIGHQLYRAWHSSRAQPGQCRVKDPFESVLQFCLDDSISQVTGLKLSGPSDFRVLTLSNTPLTVPLTIPIFYGS